jgi:hypothetical protein
VFPESIAAMQTQGNRRRLQELALGWRVRRQEAAGSHEHEAAGNGIPQCPVLLQSGFQHLKTVKSGIFPYQGRNERAIQGGEWRTSHQVLVYHRSGCIDLLLCI